MVIRKKRLGLDEFVGLEALKSYLNTIWANLSQEEPVTESWSRLESALVYGPSGSGKMSYLVSWLVDRGLISAGVQSAIPKCNNKVFLIDFGRIFSTSKTTLHVDFLQRLLHSINDYVQSLTQHGMVLVILKNLELLYEEADLEPYQLRFLADLLSNIELNSPSCHFRRLIFE